MEAKDFLSAVHQRLLLQFLASMLHKIPTTEHPKFTMYCYTFMDRRASGYIKGLELHLVTFPISRIKGIIIGDTVWIPEENTDDIFHMCKVLEIRRTGLLIMFTLAVLDTLNLEEYTNLTKG